MRIKFDWCYAVGLNCVSDQNRFSKMMIIRAELRISAEFWQSIKVLI